MTFDSIFNITTVQKKRASRWSRISPTVDPTPIWPLIGAIFKGAPHPNAAKLFLSWLLEPEQQIATDTWSGAHAMCRRRAGYKPICRYQVANDYGVHDQRAQIVELRKQFEGYTGPVVNAGGVR